MTSSGKTLVSLKDIALTRDDRQILSDITLDIEEGKILTVIGPNGAGKSSLVKIICGILKASSGTRHCHPSLRIGYVPQVFQIDTAIPMKVSRFLSLAAPEKSPRHEALQLLNIEHLNDSQMHSLSGGETQRVLLARAVLKQPNMLVLDEAMQGVDINGQAQLYRLIAELRKRLNCSVLMVSHDLHLVMEQSDTVVCLNQHVCCHGKPESVTQHPEYQRLFGLQKEQGIAVYNHQHDHHHNVHGEAVQCEQGCQHDD